MIITPNAKAAILATVQAADASSPLSAYHHVMLENAERFIVHGSNGHMQVGIAGDAIGPNPFHVCIPADRLARILNNARGDLAISVKENAAILKCADPRAQFTLPTVPADKFPLLPEDDKKGALNWSGAEFNEAISRVLPFAAINDVARPWINGVYIEVQHGQVSIVATNGFSAGLQQYGYSSEGKFSAILPIGLFKRLKGLIDEGPLTISLGQRLTLQSSFATIDAPIINHPYLDWRPRVNADQPNAMHLNAGDALLAVSDALIVAAETKMRPTVDLSCADGGIRLTAGFDGRSYEGHLAATVGAPIEARFFAEDLRQILAVFPKTACLTIGYSESGAPFSFRSDECPGYLAMLMPWRA